VAETRKVGLSGARSKKIHNLCQSLSWALLSLLPALAGCTSATVVPKDETARKRTVPGEGDYQWEKARGWIRPRLGSWGGPESIRTEAMKAFQAEAYADALDGFLALKNALPPKDPTLPEVLFRIAECYYHLGDYDNAVDYYTQTYKSTTVSQEITKQAHRRIYDIAMDYLHRKAACSFLGFRYNCPGHGVELMVGDDGLIAQYPYLEFADDAVMEIAKYYYDEKQYPEAVPVYERLVRDYCPNQSEWCELAEYQLGMATFKQVRGIDYDQQILLDAEKRFRSYLQNHPRGTNAEAARAHLREISEMLAERYLRVAKFYLSESQPRSADIYLRLVLEKYTSSSAAREAREIKKRLGGVGVGS
jgi:outer membrane protein assembly factor BamD (BamD/ComL family)